MFKILICLSIYFYYLSFWNSIYLLMMIYLYFMLNFYPSYLMINLNKYILIDNLSYWLILLTIWIMALMFLSMFLYKKNNNNLFILIFFIIMLFMFLFFCFIVNNLFLFYIFFEMSLIPTLYLILGWGYQPERLMAGYYLLFYTLFASLPLLMCMMWLFNGFYISCWNIFFNLKLYNFLVFYSMIFAFLVKMPMFLVHLWLPKAHVEAPISGSMILAAILLKLGGYGLLRIMFMLSLFKDIMLIIIVIGIYGGILISFNCLRQLDLKSLIAYSSVAHMGLVLGGMFTMFNWGVNGSFLMMIGHGLCSSGLFCLANISYERTASRSMLINKGMMNFMPGLSLWWFLLVINNMSSPLSLNLISEISLVNSIVSYSYINIFLLFMLCFFSACYCYYLYSYSQHGIFYSSIFSFSNISMREFILMFFHWFPLNVLFMKILMMH